MSNLDNILVLVREAEALEVRAKEFIKEADFLRELRNSGSISVKIETQWCRTSKATGTQRAFADAAIRQVGERLNMGYELAFQAELGMRRLAREWKLKAATLRNRAKYVAGDCECVL